MTRPVLAVSAFLTTVAALAGPAFLRTGAGDCEVSGECTCSVIMPFMQCVADMVAAGEISLELADENCQNSQNQCSGDVTLTCYYMDGNDIKWGCQDVGSGGGGNNDGDTDVCIVADMDCGFFQVCECSCEGCDAVECTCGCCSTPVYIAIGVASLITFASCLGALAKSCADDSGSSSSTHSTRTTARPTTSNPALSQRLVSGQVKSLPPTSLTHH